MVNEIYVALAQIHTQPPIDTPARIETHTRVFTAGATMRNVWEWATSLLADDYTVITQLEIRIDDGSMTG